jgi:hypothetical protein
MQEEAIEWGCLSDETGKNKASYHNRCGTTKTLPWSNTLSRPCDAVVRAEGPLVLSIGLNKPTLITAIFIIHLGLCLMISVLFPFVYSRLSIFHLSTITSDRAVNLEIYFASMAFSSEQEGVPTVPQPLWHGATVFLVSSEGFILT